MISPANWWKVSGEFRGVRQILLPKVVLIIDQWMNFVCFHHAERKESHLRLTVIGPKLHMLWSIPQTVRKSETSSIICRGGFRLLYLRLREIHQSQQHNRKGSIHQNRIWGCSVVRKGFLLASSNSDEGRENFCHHCFEKTSRDQRTYRSSRCSRLWDGTASEVGTARSLNVFPFPCMETTILLRHHSTLASFFQRLWKIVEKEETQLRIAKRLPVNITHQVIERAKEVVFIIAVEASQSERTYQNNCCACGAILR